MKQFSILVVEDEQIIAFNLKSRLEKLGYTVPAFVATGSEAIAAAEVMRPDLILMDIMLEGGMDGVETATIIRERFGTPFLYLTASSDEATVQRAKKTNPLGYLIKPFDENLLRITLEMALYKHNAERKIQSADKRLKKINDCFLGFGVLPLDNIGSLIRLCGELLQADQVAYCSCCERLVPAPQVVWNGEEITTRAYNPACTLCNQIMASQGEEVTLYTGTLSEQSNPLNERRHQVAEGVFLGLPVRQDGRNIGVLTVFFADPREKTKEMEGVMGIVASAIRIEEGRHKADLIRKKLQEQLIQSQKLEAIGTMAGGVAHEINNPLMGIINYAQLIFDRLPKDSKRLAEFAGEIIKEGERIASIVRDLLAFSRKESEGLSTNTAETVISGALALARRMLEKDEISFTIDIDQDLPPLLCKEQQIEQVILNLLTNARDAVNARYRGYHENKKIFINTSLIKDDKRKMVRIDVRDTGGGIPGEIAHKLFDPFFSTKPKHKGTGLGLAVSYGIVQEHLGELSFEPSPGGGAVFHLDLPAAPIPG